MGFRKVMDLDIMYHLFRSYWDIDRIYLEENTVNMMGLYNPSETLTHIIEHMEKGK